MSLVIPETLQSQSRLVYVPMYSRLPDILSAYSKVTRCPFVWRRFFLLSHCLIFSTLPVPRFTVPHLQVPNLTSFRDCVELNVSEISLHWRKQRGIDFSYITRSLDDGRARLVQWLHDVTREPDPSYFSVSSSWMPHGHKMGAPPSASPPVPIRTKKEATRRKGQPLYIKRAKLLQNPPVEFHLVSLSGTVSPGPL